MNKQTGRSWLSARDIEVANKLLLGRQPTETEIKTKLDNHQTLDQLAATYWSSPEFIAKATQSLRTFKTDTEEGRTAGGQTLIHLHIPKTAGSSLSAILSREYETRECLSFNDNTRHTVTGLSRKRLAEIKLVFGHLSHGVAALFPQKCHYITVLRQPKERLLSLYRYTARREDHPLHGVLTKNNMSFGQYLEFMSEHPGFVVNYDNSQIRTLASDTGEGANGAMKAHLLQKALSNITALDMTFGLTEHFEDFIALLLQKGFITDPEEIRRNSSPSPTNIDEVMSDMTDHQMMLLDRFTEWDQKFYDICKTVFFTAEKAVA